MSAPANPPAFPSHEQWNDARLISAAPDLLAALRDVTPQIPPPDATCHRGICTQEQCARCRRIIRAHAAIAKAEGREP